MTATEIIRELDALHSETNRAGMARFGINIARAFGVSVSTLRQMRRRCGESHELALELWATEWHEARILASIVDNPVDVTAKQMEEWVREFDSWDLCDQCCDNLFRKTPFAWRKAVQWSGRKAEFQRRAGFTLMAVLAIHDKTATDAEFLKFLPLIEKQSSDDRNFVRKAVNWALRGIGKRNAALRQEAIASAEKILAKGTKPGKWIARDALRELNASQPKGAHGKGG